MPGQLVAFEEGQSSMRSSMKSSRSRGCRVSVQATQEYSKTKLSPDCLQVWTTYCDKSLNSFSRHVFVLILEWWSMLVIFYFADISTYTLKWNMFEINTHKNPSTVATHWLLRHQAPIVRQRALRPPVKLWIQASSARNHTIVCLRV